MNDLEARIRELDKAFCAENRNATRQERYANIDNHYRRTNLHDWIRIREAFDAIINE